MITVDGTLLFQIVNIIVLMFLLNWVLYKPVRKILKERAEKMQAMQDEIVEFEKKIKLQQEKIDTKMVEAAGKAKAALDSARAEAQAAGDEKLSGIKAEVDVTRDAELGALKAHVKSARSSLKSDLDGFASDMASKILGRSL